MRRLIDLNECLGKGLIRKITPSKESVISSLKKAETFLLEAKGDLKDERYNSAIVMAYIAILNASRALLFRDGYRERSHACVTRYIEEKYKNKIPKEYIDLLDHYRETRHDLQYEADYFAEAEESKQIIEFAEKFIKWIKEETK